MANKKKTPKAPAIKVNTTKTRQDSIVVWQQTNNDQAVPESALLISFWTDIINIKQDGREITLNYESIDVICTALKSQKNA